MLSTVCLLLASTSGLDPAPKSLFNGKDLSGWVVDVPALDKDPKGQVPFFARDGKLVTSGNPVGHLITEKSYLDYRLVVEYRFAGKAGNCGILVHCSKPRSLYGMFPTCLEVQMQSGDAGDFWCLGEDITVPDMVARRGPKENWGVDGDKAKRIVNLTDGSENKVGEWNKLAIECAGDTVKVWVNGAMVNDGKGCTATKGRIALQSEGCEVEFRKIDLSPLKTK